MDLPEFWSRRIVSAGGAIVIAGFSMTAFFGFLPPETPVGVRVGGMLVGLSGVVFASRQGSLHRRERERANAIADELDGLVSACERAVNDVIAAPHSAQEGVFKDLQRLIGDYVEKTFGERERIVLLDGVPRRNAYVERTLGVGEYPTSIVLYERRLVDLRSRVLSGRIATVSGFRYRD